MIEFILVGLAFMIWPAVKAIYVYFIKAELMSEKNQWKKEGNWAIVTGATDGIGKEFCITLAKNKLNVILVSRTQSKLDELAKHLESTYKVQTMVISCDFTKLDIYSKLSTEIEKVKNITILINNVGMSYDHPDYYSSSDDLNSEFISSLLNCNISSVAQMSRILTNKWVKENTKNKKYLLNIGSFSGKLPTPMLALYSGSKSFVYCFSRALTEELVDKNISVQNFSPMFIVSKMSKIKRESLFIPSASKYAESALNMLGLEPDLTGYFWHEIASSYMRLLPESIILPMIKANLNKSREIYLKKNKKSS